MTHGTFLWVDFFCVGSGGFWGFGSSWYTTYGAVQFIGVAAKQRCCVFGPRDGRVHLTGFRGCIAICLVWITTCTASGMIHVARVEFCDGFPFSSVCLFPFSYSPSSPCMRSYSLHLHIFIHPDQRQKRGLFFEPSLAPILLVLGCHFLGRSQASLAFFLIHSSYWIIFGRWGSCISSHFSLYIKHCFPLFFLYIFSSCRCYQKAVKIHHYPYHISFLPCTTYLSWKISTLWNSLRCSPPSSLFNFETRRYTRDATPHLT
ncbi:hypothetical protein DM02DRAFT_705723 [Periconia macrospinosa]|uniref:Uncharacterized protein n=1 Tax=Periconia macrospinosa TaxID=97972 RepID=A0A2V1EBY7_9PLEO|nr:hypothetical protein DM02DRAFT_705723 [Periconia macrospinosa]